MGIFVSGTNSDNSVVFFREHEATYAQIIDAIDNHKVMVSTLDEDPAYVVGYNIGSNSGTDYVDLYMLYGATDGWGSGGQSNPQFTFQMARITDGQQMWDYDFYWTVPGDYSPEFTGTPTAPTASAGTNTTQIATTAFVQTAVAGAGGATITYGNTDLTAGTSPLATGTFYAYYE